MGGVERSPIKKSWGEGVKMKKNHWGRGLSNIEKHGAGGGGGGGLPGKKNIGCGVSRRSGRCQDIAIKCCTGVSKNQKRADACKFHSMKFRAGSLCANVCLHFYT